jgi:peptide/nickel transport system ATP-binding protein
MSLLQLNEFQIAYPTAPDWVVDRIAFTLEPGERLGLVGESGCGKSTIGKAILQLLPQGSRTAGELTFEGQEISRLAGDRLRRFRGEAVSLVFQDPMTRMNPLLTIGDHCVETLQAHDPRLTKLQARARAQDALTAVKIPSDRWTQYPHEFSGGMRQRVAIALALMLNPKLIVADEPTTSLDVTVSAQILDELKRLCSERNMALLLISHDLAMIGETCDRIAVMYQGKIVELNTTSEIFNHPQHPYTRSLIDSALYLQAGSNRVAEAKPADLPKPADSPRPLLELHDLKQHYKLGGNLITTLFSSFSTHGAPTIRAVDGITLSLHQGETLGLVGESGCGKSTLSKTILQLIKPTSGSVRLNGQELTTLDRTALRRQRREMQMIFQDPNACLNPRMTIGESIADPLLIHKMATPQEAIVQVSALLDRVGLDPKVYLNRYPNELSGGQQQRVAIARALITRPKLVICDEPVSMLDATVRTQVLDLMQELKDEFNLTYLFITHDLWVAKFFCDRIAVMYQGKMVEIGQTSTIFKNPQHDYTKQLLTSAPMIHLAA